MYVRTYENGRVNASTSRIKNVCMYAYPRNGVVQCGVP